MKKNLVSTNAVTSEASISSLLLGDPEKYAKAVREIVNAIVDIGQAPEKIGTSLINLRAKIIESRNKDYVTVVNVTDKKIVLKCKDFSSFLNPSVTWRGKQTISENSVMKVSSSGNEKTIKCYVYEDGKSEKDTFVMVRNDVYVWNGKGIKLFIKDGEQSNLLNQAKNGEKKKTSGKNN